MDHPKNVGVSDTAAISIGEAPVSAIGAMQGTASMSFAPAGTVQVFQFVGLLCATEYNAQQAIEHSGTNRYTVDAINALLTAYAALQALVLETALLMYPTLYDDKNGFRGGSMTKQYQRFLEADGRSDEVIPDVIKEIGDHRKALTHSEPDNPRSAVVGRVISPDEAMRFARSIRQVAEWLWQGKRPGAVALGFDQPNFYLNQ